MKLALRLIPALMLVLIGVMVLASCADYNRLADSAMNQACGIEGQTARETYRFARTGEYLAKDRAICVRCPGETELKCTGDPIALPVTD